MGETKQNLDFVTKEEIAWGTQYARKKFSLEITEIKAPLPLSC